jgi:hypothetical protein
VEGNLFPLFPNNFSSSYPCIASSVIVTFNLSLES